MWLAHRTCDTIAAGMADGTQYRWLKAGQAVDVADEHVPDLLTLNFKIVDPPKKTRAAEAKKTPVVEAS